MTVVPQVLIQTGIEVEIHWGPNVMRYKVTSAVVESDGARGIVLEPIQEGPAASIVLKLPPIEQATITHKQYIASL